MKGAFDGIQGIKRDEVFDKKRKKALDLHQELFHPKPKFYGEDGREILTKSSFPKQSFVNSNSINDKNIKNDDLSAFIVPVALGALCFTGLAIGGAVIAPALTAGVVVAGVGVGAMLALATIEKSTNNNPPSSTSNPQNLSFNKNQNIICL